MRSTSTNRESNGAEVQWTADRRQSLYTHKMDPRTEDFDLGLVVLSVTQGVEHTVKKVAVKKNSLQSVQGRVAALHGAHLDQGMITTHALRSAYLAKVRLCEAECAVSRALGALQNCMPVEQNRVKQERDSARGVASQLQLRVEILKSFHGDGSGKTLKTTYLRLKDFLHVFSSELAYLAGCHQGLLAMLPTQGKAVLQETPCAPDKRAQLEARWISLTCSLYSLNDEMKTSKSIPCVPSDKQILLVETQERMDSWRSEIERLRSLPSAKL